MTEKSITLIRGKAGLLPLTDRDAVQIIFAGDPELYKASPMKKWYKQWSTAVEGIEPEQDVCIFAIFTDIAAWKGSSGIGENEKKGIRELMSKAPHSMVISFGSPYVLRHFPEADVLIAAYEAAEQTQTAVVRCLEGQTEFRGRLPVEITI